MDGAAAHLEQGARATVGIKYLQVASKAGLCLCMVTLAMGSFHGPDLVQPVDQDPWTWPLAAGGLRWLLGCPMGRQLSQEEDQELRVDGMLAHSAGEQSRARW